MTVEVLDYMTYAEAAKEAPSMWAVAILLAILVVAVIGMIYAIATDKATIEEAKEREERRKAA